MFSAAGIAIVVIGAVIARGDVRSYGLSDEDLVVSSAGITVGAIHYPLRMVRDIDFNVEAFNGMYVNDGAMVSGSNSDGMTNSLTFISGGAKIDCGFLLQSMEHVQQLGAGCYLSFIRGTFLSWSGIVRRGRICSRC